MVLNIEKTLRIIRQTLNGNIYYILVLTNS